MIITLLAEPRSGSTNFANWFYYNKTFTVFFNPDIKPEFRKSNNKWYQNGIHPKDYKYDTEHLLIKEDYYHYKNYSDFLEISDKVICLYRENEDEQIKSWINAKLTDNWDNEWVWDEGKNNQKEEDFFRHLKTDFNMKFLNDSKYFKISYEDLYFRDGINKVIKYLNLSGLELTKWPIGKKYRIIPTDLKKLI